MMPLIPRLSGCHTLAFSMLSVHKRLWAILRSRLTWFCLGWIALGAFSPSVATPFTQLPAVPLATNLQAQALQAENAHAVLVVFFSNPDCPYCRHVENTYLKSLHHDGKTRSGQAVRVIKINQSSPHRLIDFHGKVTRHDQFSSTQKVSFVPVVAFYHADGKPAHQPIIGALIDDFYLGYLENAIDSIAQQVH
jgi:hypothetical protein